MALGFGRKKSADDTPASPVEEAHAPSSPPQEGIDAFDFDSFADLPSVDNTPNALATDALATDASSGASNADPFGDLGTMPQNASSGASGSAFDFPDFESASPQATPFETTAFDQAPFDVTSFETAPVEATTLSTTEPDMPDFDTGFEVEQANAAQSAARAPLASPLIPPLVPISAVDQEPETPFYAPQVPVETEVETEAETRPKKKLPLVPILGALATLALAGGAASYFTGQSAPDTDETAPISPSRVAPPAPKAPAQVAPPAEAVQNAAAAQNAPPVPVAAPSVAPPGAGARRPVAAAKRPGAVNPGIAPVSAQLSRMKALWKRGADAKHRGDFAGARRYWNQGLKIQPGNIGFKESIAKLPK